MPADALHTPPPRGLPGGARLTREYRDALGRPMSGRVRITGAARSQDGRHVVVPAPVSADVTNGLLAVSLPPGAYTLTATLTTVDGHRADDTETVELT